MSELAGEEEGDVGKNPQLPITLLENMDVLDFSLDSEDIISVSVILLIASKGPQDLEMVPANHSAV